MSPIIVDRKQKRKSLDNDWNDPLGIDEARREKSRTIVIPKDSKNPVHIAIMNIGVRSLLGRKAYCLKSDKDVLIGIISDVIPPNYLVLKNKGVARFEDCISIGG